MFDILRAIRAPSALWNASVGCSASPSNTAEAFAVVTRLHGVKLADANDAPAVWVVEHTHKIPAFVTRIPCA